MDALVLLLLLVAKDVVVLLDRETAPTTNYGNGTIPDFGIDIDKYSYRLDFGFACLERMGLFIFPPFIALRSPQIDTLPAIFVTMHWLWSVHRRPPSPPLHAAAAKSPHSMRACVRAALSMQMQQLLSSKTTTNEHHKSIDGRWRWRYRTYLLL